MVVKNKSCERRFKTVEISITTGQKLQWENEAMFSRGLICASGKRLLD